MALQRTFFVRDRRWPHDLASTQSRQKERRKRENTVLAPPFACMLSSLCLSGRMTVSPSCASFGCRGRRWKQDATRKHKKERCVASPGSKPDVESLGIDFPVVFLSVILYRKLALHSLEDPARSVSGLRDGYFHNFSKSEERRDFLCLICIPASTRES